MEGPVKSLQCVGIYVHAMIKCLKVGVQGTTMVSDPNHSRKTKLK